MVKELKDSSGDKAHEVDLSFRKVCVTQIKSQSPSNFRGDEGGLWDPPFHPALSLSCQTFGKEDRVLLPSKLVCLAHVSGEECVY